LRTRKAASSPIPTASRPSPIPIALGETRPGSRTGTAPAARATAAAAASAGTSRALQTGQDFVVLSGPMGCPLGQARDTA
jgi:hypothetical protein